MSSREDLAAARRERAARIADLGEVEIVVEKLVTGGLGLGRYEGIPVLVEEAAPGDRLRVEVTERRADYARARIAEILEPGPSRRQAPCPFYDRCGGCDLQHIDDRSQLEYKIGATVETLSRLAGVKLPGPPEVISAESWGYRMRAQFQIRSTSEDGVERRPLVGYHARGTRDLVPVDRCPILVPELEEILAELPTALQSVPAADLPSRLDVAVGADGHVGFAPVVAGLPHGDLEYAVGDRRLSFDARCFVQGHRGLVDSLVKAAVLPQRAVLDDGSDGGSAPDQAGERLAESPPWRGALAFDLFSGIGLFATELAKHYERVVCVESEGVPARFARRNLRRLGLRNVEIEHRRVERFMRDLPESGVDRVLLDPPRTGLAPGVRRVLGERRPARLTYVSCDAATLARDLGDMRDDFEIESVVFLDLFPQTSHVETIVQMVARPGKREPPPRRERAPRDRDRRRGGRRERTGGRRAGKEPGRHRRSPSGRGRGDRS